ncbi:sulfurtransferase [Vibrio rotiferianus]|uniref:Sulfurtransferase n=1 Tax=Vibrio rotiferianus TaxID=190895 RepID=A0A7Y3ZCL9_9VIBR|nr:sulfurtransferase [Vibrio rotiferianus]NOH50482.1 sulfurtransferase [Vibrio rotiferianus]
MSNLISARELKELMETRTVKLLDASITFQIPSEAPKITGQWIAGSIRFDYDRDFCAHDSDLPHMMPNVTLFQQKAQALGLNNSDCIVVYDNSGTLASPRAWWMLSAMGATNVLVLNGGLPAWIEAGFETVEKLNEPQGGGSFLAKNNASAFISAAEVLKFSTDQSANILDARSKARFYGEVPEPREGLRSGHIPYSINLPFGRLLNNGAFKPLEDLRDAYADLDLDADKPLVFSCGSGVTACILLLAAHEIGFRSLSIYDGSWTEWGADTSLPIKCE